jgi:hypothetical protein
VWVTSPDRRRSASKANCGEARPIVTLETVWRILENGEWEPKATLKEASGVDDETLTNIINFLNRWNFVDIEQSPEMLIRRKPGAISPVETLSLLRQITDHLSPPTTGRRFAERVACRVCDGRDLSFIGANEVECNQCHEKQWYAAEKPDPRSSVPIEKGAQVELSLGGRLLIRLGHPQKAFHANIPKRTQYFWFQCNRCGKISTDYAHGRSKYLTCPQCQTHNNSW